MKKKKKTTKLKEPDYFIIGMQKAGTYWVTALLDSHPEIRCLPNHVMHNVSKGKTGADEGRIFDILASVDDDGGVALKHSFTLHHGGFFKNIVPLIGKVSRKKLYSAVKKRYLEWFKFQNPKNKPIVGDKTTEYVFHLDMIDDFFPKAKKICILRDPKDRVVSWHYHQIRKGRKKTKKISDKFILDYLKNRVIKEYESMLKYKGFIYCFKYEDLHKKIKEVVKKLISYLGAKDISDDTIKCIINAGSIETLRKKDPTCKYGQNKKEGQRVIFSHYDKGGTGDWKEHLTKRQAKMVDKMIGPLERKILKKYRMKKA